MTKEELQNLIQKYFRGEATAEEIKKIDQWYYTFDPDELSVQVPTMGNEDEDALRVKMLERLQAQIQRGATQSTGIRISFHRYRLAAAAILLFLLGGAFFFLFQDKSKVHLPDVAMRGAEKEAGVLPDIPPGSDRATLTLADGSTIILDAVSSGLVAREGATAINLMADGVLRYQPEGADNSRVYYNTLATPRGGQYHIVLPDGTKVWLNAASSIRFPSAFSGSERVVAITGEAYFEVAKHPAMPFKVQFGTAEVEVLGTHFNINAYEDEQGTKTTLLEGSIVIHHGGQRKVLQPGTQAMIDNKGLQINTGVNLEESIAWKNGYFQFSSTDIETLMRQAARLNRQRA